MNCAICEKKLDCEKTSEPLVCLQCLPQKLAIIENITKQVKNHFDQFYNGEKGQSYSCQIKSVDMLSSVNGDTTPGNMEALIVMYSHPDNKKYNAVKMTEYFKMDKNNEFLFVRGYDGLCGVTIACIDPIMDIKCVTLYADIALPRLKNLCEEKKLDVLSYYKSNETTEKMLPDCVIDIYKVPLITIKNPTSNYIQFYKCPLFFVSEQFISFSMKVEFNENTLKFAPGRNTIAVHTLDFESQFRKYIAENAYIFGAFQKKGIDMISTSNDKIDI